MAVEFLQIADQSFSEIDRNLAINQLVGAIRALADEIRPKPEPLPSKFFIPFLASLTGALAAFALNWVKEIRKTSSDRSNAINEIVLQFVTNIVILLNYKDQFLVLFSPELAKIGAHASQYGAKLPKEERDRLARQWNTELKPIVADLMNRHEGQPGKAGLNGILKRSWEVPKCVDVDVGRIGFVANGMPDVLRIALDAVARVQNFLDAVQDRNAIWKTAEEVLASEDLWEPSHVFMRHLYELIDSRQMIARYASDAMILMHAASICLTKYKAVNLPRRRGIAALLFGTYPYVRYTLPEEFHKFVPRPQGLTGKETIGAYPASWFGNQFEFIRDNWSSFPNH